jgi:hypothetical protein
MFQQQKPIKEKSSKCRIKIKRKTDGSMVKEIDGECSTNQLKALSGEQ